MNPSSSTPSPVQIIRFGVFEADLQTGELRKDGLRIKLQEQPFRVLTLLLERAGEVVTREELRQRLWSTDTFVDFEHSLNTSIKKLRQALGDSADNPRFVETLARRGYRFIAPVNQPRQELEDKIPQPAVSKDADKGGPTVAKEAGSRVRRSVFASVVLAIVIALLGSYWLARREKEGVTTISSLAILPFTNTSGDPNVEYLTDGITESLINRFSRLRQLRVVPRTTVFRYKRQEVNVRAVGRELKVDCVLTGRVLQRGETLNVQAELVNVTDGSQLWGEQYQRELGSLMEMQEEIARVISERLRLQLTGEEQKELTRRYTQNAEAYRLYMNGLYFWNKRTESEVHKAIDYFQQGVGKDPNYALAYAMLSDCYAILATAENSPPNEMYPKAREAATRALKIDDTLAEGHMRLASAELGEWNWKGAEQEYQRTIELNPGLATAHQRYSLMLMVTGRTQESLAEIRRALELDPVSLSINTSLGWRLYFARRYDEAIEQLGKTLEMDPNFAGAHLHLGRTYVKKGRYSEALAAFRQSHAYSKLAARAMEGYTLAVSGQKDEARRILSELKQQSKLRHVSPYDMALIHTGLGDKDQALSLLQKACDDRVFRVVFLGVEPLFDDLRPHPRFQALLKRIGLPLELDQ